MVKFLKWDSAFFFKKIGLLEIKDNGQNIEYMNPDDWDLIYLVSDEDFNLSTEKFNETYSETKVVFSKRMVSVNDGIDKNISAAENNISKNQIYALALESGKFSRFNLDPKFTMTEFKKLYYMWVDNSFHQDFANAVLVYKLENKIVGFITYKISEYFATIGLIAVSPICQGIGIGRKLINAVEIELRRLQIGELRIPTQLQNEKACEFYIKLGFEIIEKKIIKHYWKV